MKSKVPYSHTELVSRGRQRVFTGQQLAEIAFPLGGIGTGTISLGGRGNLQDWEIYNRASKGANLPMTFFAVWAKQEGKSAVAKILERQYLPPFSSSHGFERGNLSGVARMDEAKFCGEYPFASIEFQDREVPLKVSLEAFNPFIPMNVKDSSYPIAIFNWKFENRTSKPIEVSLLSTMQNPVGWRNIGVETNPFPPKLNQFRDDTMMRGLWFTAPNLDSNDPNYGTAALTTTWEDVDVQTRLYRGGWWDSAHMLWDDFAEDGWLEELKESVYGEDNAGEGNGSHESGALAMRATVPAKKSVTIPVIIAWHFPYIKCWTEGIVARTYAGKQFHDAWDAAAQAVAGLERLTSESRAWHKAAFKGTLPAFVVDAITSQASIIRTQTCFRLADGQFYGWEGCSEQTGCCAGTCMHVWNYEQSLAFLFPSLERSIRRNEFLNNIFPDGHMPFRTSAPANTRMSSRFHACGDGQMGAIIRAYRDWKMCGDDSFIREIWANIKLALEYAWTAPNGWDPNKDGVMEGCQHNTYDIEFYGPNTMMGAMYLGALRACEEIARHFGETAKANEYRKVFESGRAWMDAELWNGEYYFQKVDVMNGLEVPERLRVGESAKEGECGAECECNDTPDPKQPARDEREVKYQYGEGCLSDQLLGQWASHVSGLGHVLDPEKVKQAVLSIFQNNFRKPIGSFSNVQRVYAMNDDAGLLLCSWPHGNRPRLPFVYSDEVWTGIEYQVAAHLIYEGHLDEGLAIVKGVRDRHDGERRNPWNEFECGNHYARAMSSWSVLLALSGFSYDAITKSICFQPTITPEKFKAFFSAGSCWGTFEQKSTWRGGFEAVLQLSYGCLTLNTLAIVPEALKGAPEKVDVQINGERVQTDVAKSGKQFTFRFLELVELVDGDRIRVAMK